MKFLSLRLLISRDDNWNEDKIKEYIDFINTTLKGDNPGVMSDYWLISDDEMKTMVEQTNENNK